MKKTLFSLVAAISLASANVNTTVSILPQKYFVEKIGGEKVDVQVMVKPGASPHSYEPKPSQMVKLSKSKLYFSIGVEFEEAWLKRFSDQNKNLVFVDTSKGIKKIEMTEHHHHDEHDKHEGEHKEHHDDHDEHKDEKHHDDHKDHGHHDEHKDHDKHDSHHDEHKGHDEHAEDEHRELDPHIWLSPVLVKKQAQAIVTALKEQDAANSKYYENNYQKFLEEIEETDSTIRAIFKVLPKNSSFLVFHPSWGYFAKDYGLEQVAIEVEGKEPKPRELKELIKEAKEENARAIFVQPQFSKRAAQILAAQLNIPVVTIDPLGENWKTNMESIANAIANKVK